MPTHAPKKEMPAMMSIKTSAPESSGAIFNVLIGKKMSAVRVTKIRDFDITPPRKSAFQIETPPDVPRQHSLTIFSARRGGGKSVACTTYVKKLLEVGAMQRDDHNPDMGFDKDIFAPLNIQEEDVIEP